MTNKITHIFFDLDRTLWDFEANSHDELMAIYKRNNLMQLGISLPLEFIKIYKKINEECWELYRKNEITKEVLRGERFRRTLEFYGIQDEKLGEEIGLQYVTNCPHRTKIIPHSIEVLDYLSSKYEMHMITNGFEEVQHIKLKECNMGKYFGEVVTSEMAGVKKPNRKIFDMATERVGVAAENCLYVGDDLVVDAIGAVDAGWQTVYFNPHKVSHNNSFLADIQSLDELFEIL